VSRILAIGAHPDDIEVGCAGLLQRGESRRMVVLSAGECGGDVEQRVDEQERSAGLLKATLMLHRLPDTSLDLKACVSILEGEVATYRPDLVLTHSPHDTHQDHRMVYDATVIATRDAECTVLSYVGPSCAATFQPTTFAPLSDDQMSHKLTALGCHESQSWRCYLDPAYTGGMGRYWAMVTRSRAQWVEPFETVRAWTL
jgi:LmbE family N-acetylglucosaminyl deacetylase